MKIEDLITGKRDDEQVEIGWTSISVSALKKLMEEGYEYLQPYNEEKSFSLWGKTCTGCLSAEQIQERA